MAEFAVHPADSVDSVWVKLAHTQDEQGWVREKELKKSFVPTDSISQAIHLFSDTPVSYTHLDVYKRQAICSIGPCFGLYHNETCCATRCKKWNYYTKNRIHYDTDRQLSLIHI